MELTPCLKLFGLLLTLNLVWNSFALTEDPEGVNVEQITYHGQVVNVAGTADDELRVFCHPGRTMALSGFWSSTLVRLQIRSDNFLLFLGSNVSKVMEEVDIYKNDIWSSLSSASGLARTWQSKDIRLNPFVSSCLGVLTKNEYQLCLQLTRVNYWQVLMTIIGLALYFYAPKLCRNVIFHYGTGVLAGITFSLLLVTYFVQRKFRSSWMGWFLGMYSLSLYFLTSMWYNVKVYFYENHLLVLGYLVLTGLISFALCYRMGPVENPRTINLIQWTLQLLALVLIYISSYHQTASLALAITILTWASIPAKTKSRCQTWYRKRFFKPQIRLLTEAEYLDQSRVETDKALAELRTFCKSPKSPTWRLVTRLQSPTRFAEFVEGSPHVTEDEVMNYSRVDYDSLEGTEDEDDGAVDATAQMMTDDEESIHD